MSTIFVFSRGSSKKNGQRLSQRYERFARRQVLSNSFQSDEPTAATEDQESVSDACLGIEKSSIDQPCADQSNTDYPNIDQSVRVS